MILADKIMMLRKKCGWSQEELADQLDISRQSVSKWESGMSIPDLEKIVKMSVLFGVSTDYLLKDEIEDELPSETLEADNERNRVVSLEEANTYMNLIQDISKNMALAISVLILSPIPLLLLGGLSEVYPDFISENMAGGLGLVLLMCMVILGVAPLILNGMRLSKYEYLEKEIFSLQYGVRGVVEKKKADFEDTFRKAIVGGVSLCIASVIPLFLCMGFSEEDFVAVCCVCILLAAVSGGVFLFVSRGMIYGSYSKLLQEGDYEPEKKKNSKLIGKISSVYWCSVTAIYLFISFTRGSWHSSWIIWPVAGVLFAVVVGIVNLINNNQN